MTKFNGIEEPCCVCGKPTKNIHQINCMKLPNQPHGTTCDEGRGCMLTIGNNCLKKLEKYGLVEKKRMKE